MNIKDPVEKLAFVGPIYAKRLQKFDIKTIEDLIYHFPFRYDDFSLISPISRIQPGETVTITGKLEKITNEYTKNGKKIQKATVSDHSGNVEIIWFNQPFLIKTIRVGEIYNFSGKVEWFARKLCLISPEYEKLPPLSPNTYHLTPTIHTGRLVPIYPETYGISSKWLRSRIRTALEYFESQINEFLPPEIIQKENLLSEKQAVTQIHFPDNKNLAETSRNRLAFDELLLIQLAALLRKKEWQNKTTTNIFTIKNEEIEKFIKKLPFQLTRAQNRCIKEILNDLQKEKPMNRLLQGDVGSGKTVVAAIAAYTTFLNDYNTILMAPTEILANQHHQTLTSLLEPYGVKIELVTGTHKPSAKCNLAYPCLPAGRRQAGVQSAKLKNKDVNKVIIGTHALLFQEYEQEKIGLVIVDEQHRFGVEQRSLLSKKGSTPHFLTMTATPIPRTIALTLFGDLDLSVIDEMPVGRLKVKTWVVPKIKRNDAYKWIKERIKGTPEQAFIICPFIDESETMTTIKAATKEFEKLTKEVFPDLRLGLLHGKIKSKEKEQILQEFKKGKLDILVATPVVEVGIDVPNATIMLIEGADRFGLAQLHQLRGRVGRSNLQSYCFLFTEIENEPVVNRLKSLEKTCLGFELAEIDLKLRGPGEVYGTKQHGFPDLRLASFTNLPLIEKTRSTASLLITDLPAGEAGHSSLITNSNSPLNLRLKKYRIETVNN